jgi:hypothetical protein
VYDGMTKGGRKKKDLKIGFLKYGNTGETRGSVLLLYIYMYIYIYIYIYSHYVIPRPPIADDYTHPFPFHFFYLKLKKFLREAVLLPTPRMGTPTGQSGSTCQPPRGHDHTPHTCED